MKPYIAASTPDFRDAACRHHDNNLWFDTDRLTQAKAICADCPIIDACLNYALTLPVDTEGMYAGRTQTELHKMRKAHNNPKPIPHGTHAGYSAHRRYGIPQCQPCLDAAAKYRAENKAKKRAKPTKIRDRNISHGTNSGAIQHGQYGIPICEPCRQARNHYMREWAKQKRAKKQGSK